MICLRTARLTMLLIANCGSSDMPAKADVDATIDNHHGASIQMVLVGSDVWPAFLAETRLIPQPVGSNDEEVIYRGIACRRGIAPDGIKLVAGD